MRYTVLVDGSEGAYGVVFPDLPGCTAMAGTFEDVLIEASDVALDWMRVMEAQGQAIPKPRRIDELRTDPEVLEDIAAGSILASVVVVRDASRPVKANLSIDAGVLAAIDGAAKRLGLSRSALVELLAKRNLATLT